VSATWTHIALASIHKVVVVVLLLQVVGDEALAERFIESNETLRRGIMFSASLYL
jgi:hypothetical protein